MGKNIEKIQKQTEDFVKMAFCADGTAKLVYKELKNKKQGLIEVTDSKRGKFYVGMFQSDQVI